VKRLLIVDDEESILIGIRRFMRSRGYEVDCAREREEAEALVGHIAYDCVIADLCLTSGHGADGFGVLNCVQASAPGTPIVVLTALGSEETEAEARRLGANAFLRKPTPLDDVAAVVARLVGGAS
jgi:DNA-binding response OmpR family regulator